MVHKLLDVISRWYHDTTEETMSASPWIGYRSGYAYRCYWAIVFVVCWVDDATPLIHAFSSAVNYFAMLYCWSGTCWSLISGTWQSMSGGIMFTLTLLSFSTFFYWPLVYHSLDDVNHMAYFIASNSSVHPLVVLSLAALYILRACARKDGVTYYPWSKACGCSFILLLAISFTRTFTLRFNEVSSGLSASDRLLDTLRGRRSRGFSWLIGLISWLQCLLVSYARIARTDWRFEQLYEHEPLFPRQARMCSLVFVALISMHPRCSRFLADLAMALFCGLPALWLAGEVTLLENTAPGHRCIYHMDLIDELLRIKWFQALAATQGLIQAGCHPLAPLLPFACALDEIPGVSVLSSLMWALIASMTVNHAVDFYLREAALKSLQEEAASIQMGEVAREPA